MIFGCACALPIWPTSAAPASGLTMLNTSVLLMFQAITAQPQCSSYSFDVNGNILSRHDFSAATAATWGSSVYGCFNWASADLHAQDTKAIKTESTSMRLS
jgi:hypothetical protein